MDFKGKVAIVTGGANGIGKATCTALLDRGMKVCCCDVNESAGKLFLQEMPDNSNIIFVNCDVSSSDAFRAAFEKTQNHFGRIDVVINNAGIMNEHQWKKVVEVNFLGVIHGIHLAFEFMGKNNGGSGGFIINTASNTGLEPFPLGPVYSGTKHGVVGLTKSYGQPYHFEKTGISVNAVCPGPIDTQMFRTFPSFTLDEEVATEHNLNLKPISPAEVAEAVIKLLHDGKNGALLRVDNEGVRYEQ